MKYQLSVFVRNEMQYQEAQKYSIDTFYSDDIKLVKKYPEIYFEVPKNYQGEYPNHLLIRDAGLLLKQKSASFCLDYSMNIANQLTIEVLKRWPVKNMTISLELGLEDLKFFQDLSAEPIEYYIYGYPIDMTLKSHPLIKENGIVLEDIKKRKYHTRINNDTSISIFHYEPINRIAHISDYKALGITKFRIDFLDESADEIKKILENIVKALQEK